MVLFLRVVCFSPVDNKVQPTCGYRTDRFRVLVALVLGASRWLTLRANDAKQQIKGAIRKIAARDVLLNCSSKA